MHPFLREHQNQIIQGDCLQVLPTFPDECIDCVITSPPYNLGGNFQAGKIYYGSYATFNDNLPESDYQTQQITLLNECYRVTKPDAVLFYSHKLRKINGLEISPLEWIIKSKWKVFQTIVNDQRATANVDQSRCFPVHENIWVLIKHRGVKLTNTMNYTDVWQLEKRMRKDVDHPASFPLELVKRCLLLATKEGDWILDPYSGTGTTVQVSRRYNRNAIGIELASQYIQLNERAKKGEIDQFL